MTPQPRIGHDEFAKIVGQVGRDVPAVMGATGLSRATVYRRLGREPADNRGSPTCTEGIATIEGLIPSPDPGHIRRAFDREVEGAWQLGGPVLLLGESGSGKTSSVRELAATLQLPYLKVPCDSSYAIEELFGGLSLVAGNVQFVEGLFLKVMAVPSVILLDEVGALDPRKALILHSLMDGRSVFLKEAGRVYHMHEQCSLFLASNPPSAKYHLSAMSAATVNRLLCIYAPRFRDDEVKSVLKVKHPGADPKLVGKLLKFYGEVRRLIDREQLRAEIGIRNLICFFDTLKLASSISKALHWAVLNGVRASAGEEEYRACRTLAIAVFGKPMEEEDGA